VSYRPRRLRKLKGPRWALIVPPRITREQAEQIKKQWRSVQRQDTVVVSSDFEVRRLR
jgi:hypothetical protein